MLVAAGHSKEEQEREAIRFLVSRNCDALIVHVERLPDKFLVDHDHNTTPLVVMNRKVRGLNDHCFSLNNELGGYLATNRCSSANTSASPTSRVRSTGWMPSSVSPDTSARWPRRA